VDALMARLFWCEVDWAIEGLMPLQLNGDHTAEEIRKLIGCLRNIAGRLHYRTARQGGYPIGRGGRVLAVLTPHGLDRKHYIHPFNRQQCACLPSVTGLSTGPPPAWQAAWPLVKGLGWIARRWPRRSPRILL
jgi:hypothetical protein